MNTAAQTASKKSTFMVVGLDTDRNVWSWRECSRTLSPRIFTTKKAAEVEMFILRCMCDFSHLEMKVWEIDA